MHTHSQIVTVSNVMTKLNDFIAIQIINALQILKLEKSKHELENCLVSDIASWGLMQCEGFLCGRSVDLLLCGDMHAKLLFGLPETLVICTQIALTSLTALSLN